MSGIKINICYSRQFVYAVITGVVLVIFFLHYFGKDKENVALQKRSKVTGKHYSPRIYTYSEGMWLRNLSLCHVKHLEKLSLKTYVRTQKTEIQVYTYDPKEDLVSRDVHQNHVWEAHVFNTIFKHIRSDPEIDLVDLGANLGIISMHFAQLGRRVISVEAAVPCVTRMCASTTENGLSDRITIVHNAISNSHKDVPFVLPSKSEYALSFVEQGNIRKDFGKLYGDDVYRKRTIPVKSVMLDDLLNFPVFSKMKKVFIKIDVQGYEPQVFEGATKFFQQVDVKGIYMEWLWHKNKPSGEFLKKKFQEWKFEPYNCNRVLAGEKANLDKDCNKADIKVSGVWDEDILWLPMKSRSKYRKPI